MLLVLVVAGCEKQSTSPSAGVIDSPEIEAARARAVQDGLTPSMSDVQILRALGHDPDVLTSHRTDGKDGYSTAYTNDTTDITITRSLVTGISVLRLLLKDQQQHWMLETR
ncbi:MAG: hypothetical protein ABIU09_01960 [Pyrinomonadaceae bacterium]